MMQRLRTWLLEKFLPAWAKDSVYKENAQLRAKIADLEAEIREMESYMDGVGAVLRVFRRGISINNTISRGEESEA